MGVFDQTFLILAILLFELIVKESIATTSSLVEQPSPSKEDKFLIRKCCGPGQVYNFNWEEDVADRKDRCVKYSITSSHPLLQTIVNSQQIFLGPEQTIPPQYAFEDVIIDPGFPRNCTPDRYGSTLILLEPDTRMGDLFYPIANGRLLVPHRFWVLHNDDHCIEDFFLDGNFDKARRVAFICTSHARPFPTTAIDVHGKLQLDFVGTNVHVKLSEMAGRKVVRKCCDRHEVYSRNLVCVDNKAAATQFFDDLQLSESSELFFRFGSPDCFRPYSHRQRTIQFQLTSNGTLEIQPNNQQVSIEHYCMEDIVYTDSAGLPITSNLAIFCTDTLEVLPEAKVTVTGPPPDTVHEAEVNKTEIPKCCPAGHIMKDEEHTCQLLNLGNADLIISQALNNHIQQNYNISSTLVSNSSLPCQHSKAITLKPNRNTFGQLVFESNTENELSFFTYFYIENYWDFKVRHQPFCVDLTLLRNEKEVFYQPQVFYCTSQSHVSIHYPILLCVSAVGLLITFIIYFIVPTSGSAKLVTSGFGGGNRRTRVQTIAQMLTGRILLCHIITLCLTFTCLAIVQLELIPQGQTACVFMGFTIYWASIASFSWLTVYCFDYYRIFSGSFKVSNEMLFIPYSAFGWGFPILAVSIATVAQFQSTQLGVSSIFNPNMGLLKCWFADGTSALIFFYIPVGSLLLFDIACFLTLLFNPNLMHCWKGKQGLTMRTNRNTSKDSKQEQDIKMALKLFFITGIPWVFEFAAWLPFYLSKDSFLRVNAVYFFEISNLLNSLRGVVIFVIFIVFNRDVRRFLWPRIRRIFFQADSTIPGRTRSNMEEPSSTSFATQSTSSTSVSINRLPSKQENGNV
ncbi:hypothetical protein GHT06_018809 [Daphnia sinensis]|uniref:G-protein coupled receptors family 2 profile 2 domain-containing protein n=1 Tax=Daphnia sinensis TaxID=1820382 RepID=A0AAD5L6I8_9CRUS|nr:hypothetical protein GHT06_018809 [Daphnia sinensis]